MTTVPAPFNCSELRDIRQMQATAEARVQQAETFVTAAEKAVSAREQAAATFRRTLKPGDGLLYVGAARAADDAAAIVESLGDMDTFRDMLRDDVLDTPDFWRALSQAFARRMESLERVLTEARDGHAELAAARIRNGKALSPADDAILARQASHATRIEGEYHAALKGAQCTRQRFEWIERGRRSDQSTPAGFDTRRDDWLAQVAAPIPHHNADGNGNTGA